jgi:crossover junction endodeoxyribonuclease RuvC
MIVSALRIMGFDPGSRFTGYGVVDRKGSRIEPVAYGRIVLDPKEPLPQRLALLSARARDLVALHRPEVAVLESLFRGVNDRSLIVLAQARGALLAALAVEALEICELTPAEVKSAVTGNGRADKVQVDRMVRLILGLAKEDLKPDTSDALAVAICFGQRLKVAALTPGTVSAKIAKGL